MIFLFTIVYPFSSFLSSFSVSFYFLQAFLSFSSIWVYSFMLIFIFFYIARYFQQVEQYQALHRPRPAGPGIEIREDPSDREKRELADIYKFGIRMR